MTTSSGDGRLDLPLRGATFGQAVRRFYRNYAVFSGRASRSEYWLAVLFFVLVYAVLGAVLLLFEAGSAGNATAAESAAIVFGSMAGIVLLGSLVPGIAVQVRRLHDANLSGLLYLLHLVPYVGSLIVLILTILPSNPLGARFDAAWPPGTDNLPPRPLGSPSDQPRG